MADKQNTPMQELIDELDKTINELQNINQPTEFIRGMLGYAHAIKESINKLNLKEKEKQELCNFYNAGFDNSREVSIGSDDEIIEAQNYYNQKFN